MVRSRGLVLSPQFSSLTLEVYTTGVHWDIFGQWLEMVQHSNQGFTLVTLSSLPGMIDFENNENRQSFIFGNKSNNSGLQMNPNRRI